MNATKKLSFGFSSVAAGQKSNIANAEPQLIANSTKGKFTLTSAVSRFLGIGVGENIQFINNYAEIEAAIAAKDEALVGWAEEEGIDLDTQEGMDAVYAEFGVWAIAKGHQLFDGKGKALQVAERYTKEEKEEWLADNVEEAVEMYRAQLIEKAGNPDATDEELASLITVDMIKSPMVDKFQGSKSSTTSNNTGIGLPLSITDANVWAILKKDLEDPTSVNRVFDVDLNDATDITVNDGFKKVQVRMVPFTFREDAAPMVRESKK